MYKLFPLNPDCFTRHHSKGDGCTRRAKNGANGPASCAGGKIKATKSEKIYAESESRGSGGVERITETHRGADTDAKLDPRVADGKFLKQGQVKEWRDGD